MGDVGDYWNDHKDYKRSIRNKWEGKNIKFIDMWCDANGVDYEPLAGSQLRLHDGVTLDVWPQWLKWHNVSTGERGQCRNQRELKALLDQTFNVIK